MTKKSDKKKRKRKPKPTQLNQFVGSKRQKKHRPDKTQLKTIYKLMLTAIPEARVNQLILAVHWYDSAIDYIKDDERKNLKLQTTVKVRLLESIDNLREMSFKTSNLGKKEELLKKLVQKFEQTLSGILRTKTIESIYAKLKKVQARLERRTKRLEAKYQIVIGFLEEGLRPINARGESVSFRVGDMEKPRQVSVDLRSLMYSKQHAQEILSKFRKDGLLPVAIQELEYLAQICAHKPNEEERGKYIIDIHRVKVAIFEMLNNLIDYCRSNPKLARRLVKIRRKKRTKR